MREPLCDPLYLATKLSYIGYHDPETGNPIGPSYRILVGDWMLYYENGEQISYLYTDGNFGILGSFNENGMLESGQKVSFEKSGCTEHGLPTLKFSDPFDPKIRYHFKPADLHNFGDQPTIADEVATEYVEMKFVNEQKVKHFKNGLLKANIFRHKKSQPKPWGSEWKSGLQVNFTLPILIRSSNFAPMSI